MAKLKGFGVRVSAEVAQGSGEENKFAKQIQTMVDRIPDSKLPKIAVQIDAAKTRQVFQKQLNEIMKSLSLDTGQLNKAMGGGGTSGSSGDGYWQGRFKETIKMQTAKSDTLKQMAVHYKQVEQEANKLAQTEKQLASIQNQAIGLKASVDKYVMGIKNVKAYKASLDELYTKLENASSQVDLQDANNQFKQLKNEVLKAGDAGSTMGKKFQDGIAKFAGWYTVSRIVMNAVGAFKQMVTNVVELDTSLVEIQKVTDLTGASLKSFTKQAFDMGSQIGRTGKEVIDAVAEFRRAGYEMPDSMELAKSSLVMANVGDGIRDAAEASSYLISVLRGFNMDASKSGSIVDMINQVANTAPITFANIAEGLRRVSGTMAQTGASIEQTIGLLTGGFASLRDIEGVSGGLVMISQRLRGIGEDGEAIEGLAPKIAKEFKEIANIDIEDAFGELRNPYEILSDMARVLPTLTSKQRQYLGELAAGNVALCA